AHVDGLLTAEELTLALAHIAGCARCAQVHATSEQFREQARAHPWARRTPAPVRRRILTAIEGEDATERLGWWSHPVVRVALAAGVMVAALVLATSLWRSQATPPSTVLAAVVTDFRAVESDTIALAYRTDDPQQLRDYFQRSA